MDLLHKNYKKANNIPVLFAADEFEEVSLLPRV